MFVGGVVDQPDDGGMGVDGLDIPFRPLHGSAQIQLHPRIVRRQDGGAGEMGGGQGRIGVHGDPPHGEPRLGHRRVDLHHAPRMTQDRGIVPDPQGLAHVGHRLLAQALDAVGGAAQGGAGEPSGSKQHGRRLVLAGDFMAQSQIQPRPGLIVGELAQGLVIGVDGFQPRQDGGQRLGLLGPVERTQKGVRALAIHIVERWHELHQIFQPVGANSPVDGQAQAVGVLGRGAQKDVGVEGLSLPFAPPAGDPRHLQRRLGLARRDLTELAPETVGAVPVLALIVDAAGQFERLLVAAVGVDHPPGGERGGLEVASRVLAAHQEQQRFEMEGVLRGGQRLGEQRHGGGNLATSVFRHPLDLQQHGIGEFGRRAGAEPLAERVEIGPEGLVSELHRRLRVGHVGWGTFTWDRGTRGS